MEIWVPASATGGSNAGLTVTVTSPEEDPPLLSVTVNVNLYTPFSSPFTFVVDADGFTIDPAAGPDDFVQVYEVIVPEGAVEAVPSNVMELSGSVIVLSDPGLASGGKGAAFRVTDTVAMEVLPLLSVTFN